MFAWTTSPPRRANVMSSRRERSWLPGSVSLPWRERLLAEGLEMANHWTHSSPCSPSRSTMMTGRYLPGHGVVDRRLEERRRRRIPREDRVRRVDDDHRMRQRVQRASSAALRYRVHPCRRRRRRHCGLRLRRGHARRRRYTPEDAPLWIERREEARARKDRFRPAEEEVAAIAHRIVEAREDALLERAAEIDEGIAAHQEVDVRERRRLSEVVQAEDAPAPDVTPQTR